MTTAANNLYSLLRAVQAQEGASLGNRWEAVLGTELSDVEFGLRFSSVLGLWRETVTTILAMPDSAARNTRLRYALAWWHAVVMPDHQWNTGSRPALMNDAAFDVLHLAGETLSELDDGPPPPPDTLGTLRAESAEWIDLVGQSTTLSKGLKVSLVECFERITWLIDNQAMVGISPLIDETDRMTGRLVRVGVATKAPWGERITKWIGLATQLASAYHTGAFAIGDADQTMEHIRKAIES